MSTSIAPDAPASDLDFHSEQALENPFPLYRELRDLGSAVWMRRYGMFALSRYDDVRAALENWEMFSSAHGVAMNDAVNDSLKGIVLHSDPPEHDQLRGIIKRPLSAKGLRDLEEELKAEANLLVDRLLQRQSFDAVTDLAAHLPVTIVSKYVGLPDEGRGRMLEWGAASFNCFGPEDKKQTQDAFPVVQESVEYLQAHAKRGMLRKGSWGEGILDAADAGEIPPEKCPVVLIDLVSPSLDTTVHAISSAVWLLGKHPDQFEKIRRCSRTPSTR